MFPISSTTLTAPGAVNQAAPLARVDSATVTSIGTATDAPAAASVSIDLSPVAQFLLTVSQSQQQLGQVQGTLANGGDARTAANTLANTLNDATQNVVNAFNLLPSVDFNQVQPQETSLLNTLVQSLNQQQTTDTASSRQQSTAQSLAQIGVTLQSPLLSDASGGLSLDNEVLRAAFSSNGQATTDTLQHTLNTFSQLATQFAEQLSAAGSANVALLASQQQPALTAADVAANARLDLARTEVAQLAQTPLPDTGADRLATQRAALEQPALAIGTPSPIVYPLQASTAEVIAAQNAQARQALGTTSTQTVNSVAADNATQAAGSPANGLTAGATATQAGGLTQTTGVQANSTAQAAAGTQANSATQTAAGSPTDATQDSGSAQSSADAARATTAAQVARQQSSLNLGTATAASAQAAAQATIAQNAATSAAAANLANATPAEQAEAAQNVASSLATANAAAAAAAAQAQAAQGAADALSAQNAAASAAAAAALAAQSNATTPEAASAAAAIAAQQASAAQATAANLAAANAAAADAAQQAGVAQNAAARAALLQNDPLRANPALASAIAAYNISDTAISGPNARAIQSATSVIPRVGAVVSTARSRGIGNRA